MEHVSIRLPGDAVERMRVLARREAVRRHEDVTWAQLVREAIDDRLALEAEWFRPIELSAAGS